MTNSLEGVIVYKAFDLHTMVGQGIVNIFVDVGYIFAFKFKNKANAPQSYYIYQYDFLGNVVRYFSLDLDEFEPILSSIFHKKLSTNFIQVCK
jgi:hypothetical protein